MVSEPATVRPPKPLFSNVSPAVPSPCISLCRLDEQKVCLGCFRHVEDIREWRSADDARRRMICAEAEQRKASAFSPVDAGERTRRLYRAPGTSRASGTSISTQLLSATSTALNFACVSVAVSFSIKTSMS